MKYFCFVSLLVFWGFCSALEIVVDLKPVMMLVSDITKGSCAVVNVLKSSESEIHDHGTGWKPSEVQKVAKADLLISANLKKYKSFNIQNTVDLLSYVHLLQARGSGDQDVHFWLDPGNAILMVDAIAAKLVQIDCENAPLYLENAHELKASIKHKVRKMRRMMKARPMPVVDYLVLHDAYQYFEVFFQLARPVGYFYDGNHNTVGLDSIQNYTKKINNGQIKCILINNPNSRVIEKFKNKTKIIYANPIGEEINCKSGGYVALLDSVYRGYKKCLK